MRNYNTYSLIKDPFQIALITILIVFSSCKDNSNSEPSNISSFPMEIGTEWVYNRQLIIFKYNSNEIDTLNFVSRIWIEKDTILDSLSVRVFNISMDEITQTISKQYINIDDEGLKRYAYRNGGGILKSHTKILLPRALFSFSCNSNNFNNFFIEDPPVLIEKLPINEYSEWIYKQESEPAFIGISKHITGSESVITKTKTYFCFIADSEYTGTNLFKNIKIREWIANEGIIKQETTIDSVTLLDENGNPSYTTEILDTYLLNEFSQP